MSQGTQGPEYTSSVCSPHRCSVLRELVPAQLTSHPADVGSLIQDAIRAEVTTEEHRLPSPPPRHPPGSRVHTAGGGHALLLQAQRLPLTDR